MRDTQVVKQVLHAALASPPSAVGRRLRSEPDLSKRLGVGRWQLRSALSELVSDGVLLRRHGSGTYVKRVPSKPASEKIEAHLYATGLTQLRPEELFHDAEISSDASASSAKTAAATAGSRIGMLFSHGQPTYWPYQLQIAGASSHADLAGHVLSLHSACDDGGGYLGAERLKALVRRAQLDAVLVDSFVLQMSGKQPPDLGVPVVCVYHYTAPQVNCSAVYLDTAEASRLAIRELAEAGYRKIAHIGQARDRSISEQDENEYEQAMRLVGLPYRRLIRAAVDAPAAAQATAALLDEGERPDAIYCSDDFVLNGVADKLGERKIRLGRDLGVVTFANRGLPLAGDGSWARVEFDLALLGKAAVDVAVHQASPAIGADTHSRLSVQPVWRTGATIRSR